MGYGYRLPNSLPQRCDTRNWVKDAKTARRVLPQGPTLTPQLFIEDSSQQVYAVLTPLVPAMAAGAALMDAPANCCPCPIPFRIFLGIWVGEHATAALPNQ
jgi:hypothetical protein